MRRAKMAPTPSETAIEKWIDQQIARLIDPEMPRGSRLYAVVDEISNQVGVVGTFSAAVPSDVPGEACARKYLAALEGVKTKLLREATESGQRIDYESEMVYWWVHAGIVRERAGKIPAPVDLAALYREFKDKYFKDSVPELSQSFTCTFSKLPFDVAGICCLEEDASKLGIRPGIRINEKFEEFPAEAKVALLHEMVHATGVRKHGHELKLALIELFGKNAYLDPLIL
jgi:hypothetical protein